VAVFGDFSENSDVYEPFLRKKRPVFNNFSKNWHRINTRINTFVNSDSDLLSLFLFQTWQNHIFFAQKEALEPIKKYGSVYG